MNVFITAYFYVYESRFPRAMLYCPIIKVDFVALAASTRFSPRTSIWDELTDEKFNNNFVILYTKPMLQITGYIIQTTYLSRRPNPTIFIFTSFIWFISLTLISSSWKWASSSLLDSVFSISVRSMYSTFFWRNDVWFYRFV